MTGLVLGNIDLSRALANFGAVQASGGGKFVPPGKFLMQVESFDFRDGYKGITAIGTNKIVKIFQCDDPDTHEGDSGNLVENLTGANPGIAKANLKGYLLAACGGLYQRRFNERDVNEGFTIACAQPTQPLKGVYVMCEALKKPKAKNPAEFITVKNWHPIFDAELAGYGLKQPTPTS